MLRFSRVKCNMRNSRTLQKAPSPRELSAQQTEGVFLILFTRREETITNAKEYLKQAYRLNELIESDLAELQGLRDLAANISGANYGGERVQGGGAPGSRIEETVMKIIALEAEINREIDRYVDLKAEIRRAIDAVPSPNQKLILRYRYVEFLPWGEIQSRMGMEERRIFELHGEALKSFVVPEKNSQ